MFVSLTRSETVLQHPVSEAAGQQRQPADSRDIPPDLPATPRANPGNPRTAASDSHPPVPQVTSPLPSRPSTATTPGVPPAAQRRCPLRPGRSRVPAAGASSTPRSSWWRRRAAPPGPARGRTEEREEVRKQCFKVWAFIVKSLAHAASCVLTAAADGPAWFGGPAGTSGETQKHSSQRNPDSTSSPDWSCDSVVAPPPYRAYTTLRVPSQLGAPFAEKRGSADSLVEAVSERDL